LGQFLQSRAKLAIVGQIYRIERLTVSDTATHVFRKTDVILSIRTVNDVQVDVSKQGLVYAGKL
jgi:hypothetical protein